MKFDIPDHVVIYFDSVGDDMTLYWWAESDVWRWLGKFESLTELLAEVHSLESIYGKEDIKPWIKRIKRGHIRRMPKTILWDRKKF